MTGLGKAMRGVKYAMLGLGALSVLLCLIYNVFQYGVHGVLLFIACLVPTALAGLSIKLGGMPRWASAVSLVSFMIAGAKSSGDQSDLNNIMVAVFFAMLLSLVLLILPDRAKKPKQHAMPPGGYANPPPQGYPPQQQGYPPQQQGYPPQQQGYPPQQQGYPPQQQGYPPQQQGYPPQQQGDPPQQQGYPPRQGDPPQQG